MRQSYKLAVIVYMYITIQVHVRWVGMLYNKVKKTAAEYLQYLLLEEDLLSMLH